MYRAPYAFEGHQDQDRRHVVHNATMLKQTSIRLLVALKSIFVLMSIGLM